MTNEVSRRKQSVLVTLLVLPLLMSGCSQGSPLGLSPASPAPSASTAASGGSAALLAASAPGCPAWGNPGGNPGAKFSGLVSIEDAVAMSVAQITEAWYTEMGLVKEEFVAARIAHSGLCRDGKR